MHIKKKKLFTRKNNRLPFAHIWPACFQYGIKVKKNNLQNTLKYLKKFTTEHCLKCGQSHFKTPDPFPLPKKRDKYSNWN